MNTQHKNKNEKCIEVPVLPTMMPDNTTRPTIVLEYIRGEYYDNAHLWYPDDMDVNFFAAGFDEEPDAEPDPNPFYMDYYDVWDEYVPECPRCGGDMYFSMNYLCDVCALELYGD